MLHRNRRVVLERLVTLEEERFRLGVPPTRGDRGPQLALGIERYVNQPTLAHPWDRE